MPLDPTREARANAFDRMRDAAAIVNDDRRYVYVNDAACELLGESAQELLRHRIDDFIDQTGGFDIERVWQAFVGAGHGTGTLPLVRRDGTRRTLEYSGFANVAPGRHLSVLRDVTDRIALEQQARALQALTAKLVEASAPAEIIAVAAQSCLNALGAARVCVATPSEGAALGLRWFGAPSSSARLESVRLDAHLPITLAYRKVAPVFVESEEDIRLRFPEMVGLAGAVAAVPMVVRGEALGALAVAYEAAKAFDSAARDFLFAVARLVGAALDRAAAAISRQLHELFMHAPVAFAVFRGPAHRYEIANQAYCQMVGRPRLVGRTVREAFPELQEGTGVLEHLDRVYRTGEPVRVDAFRVPLVRGGVLEDTHFNYVLEPIRDDDGAVSGIMSVAVDVTEQVNARVLAERAADQLRAQRSWLEAVLAAIPTPMVLLEPGTGRLLYANASADAVWGSRLPRVEGIFSLHYRITDASGRELAADETPAARAALGEVIDREELTVETPNGPVSLLASSRALPALGDQPATIVFSFEDVTKLKALERRYRAAAAEAEQGNRLKDEFLATLSHELRTPLNAIVGWVHMMRSGVLRGDRREHALDVIERNARAQEQLIADLLDVSRITGGRLRLDVRRVSLSGVVAAAVDTVRPAAAAKQVALDVALDPGAEDVLGDADRLRQVAWNLLTNAVKFTPPGGRVQVTLAQEPSSVVLTVRDTGQGMERDFLPHVFDRFRQADASLARAHGGLGLGLAITRNLVEMHGGTIAAHSEGRGLGATFVVRLPVHSMRADATPRVAALAPAGGPSPRAARPLENARVLVVEDEPDARELVVELLEEYGAKVQATASAPEALEALKRAETDVLLSDLGLPGEDGLSLIRKVRALDGPEGRTPAVALTAYVHGEDRARALAAGFDGYLPKPIDADRLVETLAALVHREEAVRAAIGGERASRAPTRPVTRGLVR